MRNEKNFHQVFFLESDVGLLNDPSGSRYPSQTNDETLTGGIDDVCEQTGWLRVFCKSEANSCDTFRHHFVQKCGFAYSKNGQESLFSNKLEFKVASRIEIYTLTAFTEH